MPAVANMAKRGARLCSGKKLEKKRNSFSIFSESMERSNFKKLTIFVNYTDKINWTILCILDEELREK
jgi:hypothetical protein